MNRRDFISHTGLIVGGAIFVPKFGRFFREGSGLFVPDRRILLGKWDTDQYHRYLEDPNPFSFLARRQRFDVPIYEKFALGEDGAYHVSTYRDR